MFCPICGTNLPDNAVQCTACGTSLGSGSVQGINQHTEYNTQSAYTQQNTATQTSYNQAGGSYRVPPKKSNTNVILPIAIGGGVLLLALIVVLVIAIVGETDNFPGPGGETFTEATTGGEETTVIPTDVVEESVVVVDNSFVPYGYVEYRRVFASDGLNIRKMPTMNSERVITISNLNMVSVMGYSRGNHNWVYVRYLGKEGWVDSRYLSQVSVANFRVTMKDGLNLRNGPSTSYGIVYNDVPYNEVVQFIRYNSNATWAYVSYAGYYGWMSAGYLLGTYEDATIYEIEPEVLYNCSFDKEYYVTMDGYLNLRSNPTTGRSRIYTAIPEGATVYLGGYNRDKSWAYVLYDYYTGWVDADYIKPVKKETTTVKVLSTGNYKVTMDDSLNLRTEDSTSGGKSTIICAIPEGAVVVAIDFNKDYSWAYVTYGKYEGWVDADYLKPTNEKPSIPEEPEETEEEQKNEEGFVPTGPYKVTMSDGLNLRTEPSVSGGDDTVILEIPYGATVEVLEFNSDFSWAYVEYEDEGAEGWVSAKNIEYIG